MARIAEQRLQAQRVAGDILDEAGKLACKDRRDQQKEHDECQRESSQDEQRRNEPAHAAFGEALGQRIEHIGKREAENERQQDRTEQPQQAGKNGERGEPEYHVPLETHGALSLGNQCPTPNEFMWRSHSAR